MRRALMALTIALLGATPASAKPEALDFVRKDRQDRGPQEKSTWAALARDRDELRELWDRYELKGRLPHIGFDDNVAVLAGTVGSSTCPYRLHDLRVNRERKRVVVRIT